MPTAIPSLTLRVSRLRLAIKQFIPGYCTLICHRHVREPYDLPPEVRALYFEDMMRTALETVFSPIKLNFELLGNAVPHLHCHFKPRYYGDPVLGRPINPDEGTVVLTPDEYCARRTTQRLRADGAAHLWSLVTA